VARQVLKGIPGLGKQLATSHSCFFALRQILKKGNITSIGHGGLDKVLNPKHLGS